MTLEATIIAIKLVPSLLGAGKNYAQSIGFLIDPEKYWERIEDPEIYWERIEDHWEPSILSSEHFDDYYFAWLS